MFQHFLATKRNLSTKILNAFVTDKEEEEEEEEAGEGGTMKKKHKKTRELS